MNLTKIAVIAVGVGLSLGAALSAAGERRALLVGVGSYQYASPALKNLAGPANDVQIMAQTLGSLWGFKDITVLEDAEASRQAVLAALDKIVSSAKRGDHVVFYYSGHGTSPRDPGLGLPLAHTTGALLAYDSRTDGEPEAVVDSLLVGRRDLRPKLEALDSKGVYVTALIDACYSENATRGWAGRARRQAAIPALDFGEFGSGSVPNEPYPYSRVATLSASAANQTAWDIDDRLILQFPTFSGKPHGAFTDAVLRALRDRALPEYGGLDKNADKAVSMEEFFAGVRSFMGQRQYDHTPMLQPVIGEAPGKANVRSLPLFNVGAVAQLPKPAQGQPAQSAANQPGRLRVAFAGERHPLADLGAVEWVSADADITIEPEGSGYAFFDAAGMRIGAAGDAAAMREQLRRRAGLERLTSVSQQGGQATVSLAFAAAGATTRLPLGSAGRVVQAKLMLTADHAGYPLVFDLFGDGQVQRLYPYYQQEGSRRWAAGEPIDVMCVKTMPPAGVDSLYAFWLREPWPSDVLKRTQQIAANDAGAFDVLLSQLGDSSDILGAARLTVEIYPPTPGELEAWTTTCEK